MTTENTIRETVRELRVSGRLPYSDVPGSSAKTWSVKVEGLK